MMVQRLLGIIVGAALAATFASPGVSVGEGQVADTSTSSALRVSDRSGSPPTPVRIVDFAFRPRNIMIPVGSGIVWRNRGPSPHTATSDTGIWDSGILNVGDSFGRIFSEAGVFPYHCSVHPEMTARVMVTSAVPRPEH